VIEACFDLADAIITLHSLIRETCAIQRRGYLADPAT